MKASALPHLALRFALRDWRAGELRLLLAALLLAVGAVSAIGLFTDRLQRALAAESATLLGADRIISSTRPIPDAFRAAARERGLAQTDVSAFASMVFSADGARSMLASVKAVAPGYPLRGALRTAAEPFGAGEPTADVPGRGEVWLDSRLLPALGIAVGDRIDLGYASFAVSRVLISEPNRGGSFIDLTPRALMRAEDVPATRVIQPGSIVRYRLLLAGGDAQLAALKEAIDGELEPNYRWRSIRDANAAIGRTLERAESFLRLGSLLAVLLAGVAVALGANRYARRHVDHVAVLKTLGATPRDIQWSYTGVLLAIGAVGAIAGLALGALVHLAIIAALGSFLPVELPPPGAAPLAAGLATGCICLLAFALPPLIGLRSIPPMRVIRRDTGGGIAPAATYACAIAGSLALLVWHSGSLLLTFWTLAGALLAGGTFALLALALLRGGRTLGMQAGSVWRLALAGLQRRRRENVAQIMIFGLAIMLLLIMLLMRTALIDAWQARIPERAPNYFLMNIAPQEVAPVRALLAAGADAGGDLFPMIRGRIAAVNDLDPEAHRQRQRESGGDGSGGPGIRSERNLTFSAHLPENNALLEGAWWNGGETEPLVSLEADYARGNGIAVGDMLAFDIGGLELSARVANIRSVDWDSLQPNFYIIFSPGALDGRPATYMTSFHLPQDGKGFLAELLSAHPSITVIDIGGVIDQMRSIIDRVALAVELVLYLVLAAGILVLIASIQSSRDQRLREHALLRALGGSRRLISGALACEFAALGACAGLVAAFGAELTAYALSTRIFDLPATLHPQLWIAGPLSGLVVIAGVGYLGTRRLVSSPPVAVLREI